jgi:hypothetical protein
MKKFIFLLMTIGLFSSVSPMEVKASVRTNNLSVKSVPVSKNTAFLKNIESVESASLTADSTEKMQTRSSKKKPISNGVYLSTGAIIIIVLLLILIL